MGIENKKAFILQKIASLKENNQDTYALKIIISKTGEIIFETRALAQNEIVSAILYKSNKILPVVKQIDRTIYKKAKQKAQENNAQEAIFIDRNNLLETTIANLVSEENGQLITPKLKSQGLKGITRQILLDSGKVVEKEIPITTEYPLITVNCLRIMQIEKINSKQLPSSKNLYMQVLKILQKAEEDYANNYYR